MDQLNPQYLSLGNSLFDQVTNPFYGQIQTGVLAQPTVQRGYLLRPYPEFNGVLANAASWGNSTYHALQTRFEKRYSRGLSFLASYTWSKTMSDGVDGFWAAPWGNIRNWYCRSCDRASSTASGAGICPLPPAKPQQRISGATVMSKAPSVSALSRFAC